MEEAPKPPKVAPSAKVLATHLRQLYVKAVKAHKTKIEAKDENIAELEKALEERDQIIAELQKKLEEENVSRDWERLLQKDFSG